MFWYLNSHSFFPSIVMMFLHVVICWFIFRYILSYVSKLPPGPVMHFPLLGYLPFVTKEPHKKFFKLSKTYGPLVSLSLGSYKMVVVSEYDCAKELLSHPATLGRPIIFFNILPYEGGFAGMTGEPWQEQRRFCIHTMRNLGIGKGLWERIIQEDVTEFIEFVQKWKGKPVDVSRPLLRTGISTNAALFLGHRFPQKETNPDVKVIEEAHHVIAEHGKFSNPATLLPWLLKYMIKFNIAGYADKWRAMENFATIFRKEIEKRQESKESLDSPDFFGLYLDTLSKKDATSGNKHHSVENLIGNAVSLFVGGSDTVVASVSWLLVLMAEHPKIQEKVQEEIDDAFGLDGPTSWDDRKKLPYTMATIFEMERWASFVPLYPPRSVTETFEFRGYTIPKGTMIIGNAWAIHRDLKFWDNPEEFVPERFLQIAEKTGKDASKLDGFAAFSFGKRKCPGETVAIMTTFLYFTGLMQKFSVKMPPGRRMNIDTKYSAIMHPSCQELCFIER